MMPFSRYPRQAVTKLALLGPFLVGPRMSDGWFAADFTMAHKIYGSLDWEHEWMASVDLCAEVQFGGPYL
jgi:hypothetical protein